jgi:predicted nucleic acid-binding protein
MPSIGKEEFDSNDNSYKCKDLFIKAIMNQKGISYNQAQLAVSKMLVIDPSKYMKPELYKKLTKDAKDKLPAMNLDELLLKLRKNAVIDQSGEEVLVNECVLPIDVLNIVRKGNSKSVYLEDNVGKKDCKIGDITLPSNIRASLPNDIEELQKMDPRGDRSVYYGCILAPDNPSKFNSDLLEINRHYDKEHVDRMNELMNEFNRTFELKEVAKTHNIDSQSKLRKATADKNVAEAQVPVSEIKYKEQVIATRNSGITMQNKLSELQTLNNNIQSQRNRTINMV